MDVQGFDIDLTDVIDDEDMSEEEIEALEERIERDDEMEIDAHPQS